MPPDLPKAARSAQTRGAALLTLGGIAAAFGLAACCALPILLTSAGLGAAWLGGISAVTAPHRNLLLCLSALSLAGGSVLVWRMQRTAATCGPDGVCTPLWLRAFLLVGVLSGAGLLWLGYSYV